MKHLLILLIAIIFQACSCDCKKEEKLDTKEELVAAEAKVEAMTAQVAMFEAEQTSPLVHLVLLNIKDDLDEETYEILMGEIEKLHAIPEVKGLETGTFHDLSDPRAMSDYEVVIQMRFENEVDYQNYQNHEIHLALKAALGNYLAGPPVVYDYWN